MGTTDRYYLEFLDFAPDATREDVRSLYARRCADNPELSLNLLVDRIGALAPEPRSLALWGLSSWAALADVARSLDGIDHPVRLITAGTYSALGKETP